MGQKNDPHYGEQSGQEPHMGETEEPEGTGRKSTSTGTGTAEETGTDADDAGKAPHRITYDVMMAPH